MTYSLTSVPPFDPSVTWVSLGDLIAWTRTDASEEGLLNRLLLAAMYSAEEGCKQPLFQREYTIKLTGFVSGQIPAFIIDTDSLAITYTVKGLDVEVPVSVTDYDLFDGKITFSETITATTDVARVTIKVKLGFTPETLPENVSLALQLIVSDYYDNRSNSVRQLPTAADSLLSHYKRYTC